MGHLSKIAQGVFIGNGEVWNFLDYAVNRDCGSLISYTQNKDFLRFNLFNNFNGGGVRRYYNSDIAPTVTYGPVLFSDLKGVKSNAVNDDIGELYSVPNEGNSTLKFVSSDDFSSFQESIRKLQLLDNDKIIDDIKTNTEHYFLKIKGEETPVYSIRERGDEYNVPEIVLSKSPKYDFNETSDYLRTFALSKNKQIRKKQNVSDSYSGFSVTPNYPLYQGEIGAKVDDRLDSIKPILGLSKVADIIREGSSEEPMLWSTPLAKSITQNKNISKEESFPELYIYGLTDKELKAYVRPTTTITDLFNDGIDTNKVNKLVIRSDVGLYAYYDDYRKKYASSNIKPITSIWYTKKSYGVEYGGLGSEIYSVNKPHYAYETSISPVFNGGKHVTHDNSVNSNTYSFFQEADKGSTPNNFTTTSVSENTSVTLSDYSGGSVLLRKTNKLFRDNKIKSLINRFHTDTTDIDSDFITSFDNNFGLSRGRNLVKKQYSGKQAGSSETGYDNPYCRVWTAHYQYSKLKDRIRPFVNDEGNPISIADTQSNYGSLRPKDGANRLSIHSVLKNDGYLNITSSHDGGEYNKYKKYMFSLENLAWKDVGKDALSEEQQGPKGGRIMWFPPYNLKFSENVNVNWNANSFIGRGEEIYTYTNTIRSGTLDFTLLIDHPSVLNKFRGTSTCVENKEEVEQDILRYFAGCGNLNDAINPIDLSIIEEEVVDDEPATTPKMAITSRKIAYVVFFPNNFSGIDYIKDKNIDGLIDILTKYNGDTSYECGEKDVKYAAQKNLSEENKISKGVNPDDFIETIRNKVFGLSIDELYTFDDFLKIGDQVNAETIFSCDASENIIKSIRFQGFASSHGYRGLNDELCGRRRNTLKEILKKKCVALEESETLKYIDDENKIIETGEENDSVNDAAAQIGRMATIVIEVAQREDNVAKSDTLVEGAESVEGADIGQTANSTASNTSSTVSKTIKVAKEEYTYDNEYLYFSSLRSDSLEYKSIVDKVRFFEPAFHSITPEGFNSRLTFLHQCTRQGPTNAVSGGGVNRDSNDYLKFAGNLAFGRAPYCILRIGDFFNTKICIDSLSITYDNNGVQWDLNPEGAGVQPMFANISISFKFIGGQDISDPIERLQNAVTSNYYANASVYSRHADNENVYYDAIRNTYGNKV